MRVCVCVRVRVCVYVYVCVCACVSECKRSINVTDILCHIHCLQWQTVKFCWEDWMQFWLINLLTLLCGSTKWRRCWDAWPSVVLVRLTQSDKPMHCWRYHGTSTCRLAGFLPAGATRCKQSATMNLNISEMLLTVQVGRKYSAVLNVQITQVR